MGSTSEFHNSLPGIVTNDFDKIYASEMPVVVDEEQEPNISAIDLEKSL